MIAALSALTLPPPLHAQSASEKVLNGECRYPENVARFRSETTLILCNTLAIRDEGQGAVLDFGRRSWGTAIRFSGDMAGDRMTVTGIAVRGGELRAATGTCEIFHTSDRVSVVSCLARAGSRSYATNFIPSRL